jgi:hypothetical protein
MDHVVYLDHKANEFEKLLNGQKTMIIRGAAGRKIPYGRVETNDTLYFIENDGSGVIKARGNVVGVLNSDKMTKEASTAFVDAHQDKLSLSKVQYERWAGKRFLVLIEIDQIRWRPSSWIAMNMAIWMIGCRSVRLTWYAAAHNSALVCNGTL